MAAMSYPHIHQQAHRIHAASLHVDPESSGAALRRSVLVRNAMLSSRRIAQEPSRYAPPQHHAAYLQSHVDKGKAREVAQSVELAERDYQQTLSSQIQPHAHSHHSTSYPRSDADVDGEQQWFDELLAELDDGDGGMGTEAPEDSAEIAAQSLSDSGASLVSSSTSFGALRDSGFADGAVETDRKLASSSTSSASYLGASEDDLPSLVADEDDVDADLDESHEAHSPIFEHGPRGPAEAADTEGAPDAYEAWRDASAAHCLPLAWRPKGLWGMPKRAPHDLPAAHAYAHSLTDTSFQLRLPASLRTPSPSKTSPVEETWSLQPPSHGGIVLHWTPIGTQ